MLFNWPIIFRICWKSLWIYVTLVNNTINKSVNIKNVLQNQGHIMKEYCHRRRNCRFNYAYVSIVHLHNSNSTNLFYLLCWVYNLKLTKHLRSLSLSHILLPLRQLLSPCWDNGTSSSWFSGIKSKNECCNLIPYGLWINWIKNSFMYNTISSKWLRCHSSRIIVPSNLSLFCCI